MSQRNSNVKESYSRPSSAKRKILEAKEASLKIEHEVCISSSYKCYYDWSFYLLGKSRRNPTSHIESHSFLYTADPINKYKNSDRIITIFSIIKY